MQWLGIEPTGARMLGRRLVSHAGTSDDLRWRTVQLSSGMGLGAGPWQLLDELGDQLRDLARIVINATTTVESHVMHVAPRPSVPFNAAGQLASHNTYQSQRTVDDLHLDGIRSFEFDLHGPSPSGEWAVYHHAFDATSNVASLEAALASMAELPADEPLTVVLDLKDAPATQLHRNEFDQAIRLAFGDRLFTPLDFIARAPGEVTVGGAAARAGWPTFAELSGQVIVIVTGDVEPYRQRSGLVAAAFVGARPTLDAIADPHTIVYNAPSDRITSAEVVALQQAGGLVRTWGAPTDAGRQSNLLALDV